MKTSITIISGTGEFGRYIHRVYANKRPLKSSGKVTVGILRDSRKFSGHIRAVILR